MAFPLTSARRTFFALVGFAALSACGSTPPLFTDDGRNTSQVQCSASGPADTCEQNATGLCGGPIERIGSSVKDDTRTLIFACKAAQQQQ